MAVNASKREQKEFKKWVGFFEGEVVAVNPDKETLQELIGSDFEIKEEPSYLTEREEEDADGGKQFIKQLLIKFFLRDVKSKELFNVSFFLKDRVRMNKNKDKTQFINSQGASTWADEIDNLPEWFLKPGVEGIREAKDGEADLYEFIRNWLNGIDYKNDYEITFDNKKLWKGNTKEIADLMKSDVAETVLALATIKPGEDKEGNPKEFQQVYNRAFGPGYLIKQLRTKSIDDKFMQEAIKLKAEKKAKPLHKLILNITDEEYGVKEHYYLGELKEYDPKDNPVGVGNKIPDPVDNSY